MFRTGCAKCAETPFGCCVVQRASKLVLFEVRTSPRQSDVHLLCWVGPQGLELLAMGLRELLRDSCSRICRNVPGFSHYPNSETAAETALFINKIRGLEWSG